jgi:protein TonB
MRAIEIALAPTVESPAPAKPLKLAPPTPANKAPREPAQRPAARPDVAPSQPMASTAVAQEASETMPMALPTASARPLAEPRAQDAIEAAPRYVIGSKDNPAPVYPRASRQLREQGEVLIAVYVSADGKPEKVELRRGSGHERLDQAALEAVRRWRFDPARKGEGVLAAWVEVPVRFSLEA